MSRRITDELDLLTAADADRLADGSRSFLPVHLGTRDVPIGALLDLVHKEDALLPPRSGHLGNWEDIALGRSGPMDFNTAICGQGHGYPLIYGFTRTETDTADAGGDGVYLPGSLVEQGRRRPLPLFTWDGRGFAPRDRSRPLFCPLVRTEEQGEPTPLVDVHLRRMRAITGYRFELEASSLVAHDATVTAMLTVLLERAATRDNARRAFADLISHAVRLDGEVARCELRPDGRGYRLDGHHYGSAGELAEAALLPFRALTDPARFFERISDLPPVLPVVSHLLTGVLTAMFGTHYPDGPAVPADDPFITHLHWGARSMAGCPPRRGGYFTSRAAVRGMRSISECLAGEFTEASPLCVVLLPAPVFMLCPASTDPGDAEPMAALFRATAAARPGEEYDAALTWLGAHRDGLSDYLCGRFREGSGIPYGGVPREPAVPVEPEGFRDLTFRQASAIVAAFEEAGACG
ncbi:DUF6025 family protein [Streptomyces sp. NPDC048639]|uniref:DUF6025 family protein n=1 Tax=Streptomyces sp. NPDC048639 TaxID=3365581 RepID=UPI0037233BFA